MANQPNNSQLTGKNNISLNATTPVGVLRDNILGLLWRNRWSSLLCVVVSLLLGMAYITLSTPQYTSTSSLYVEQSGPRVLGESEGVMTQSKNYLYTQAELLKSTPILSAALDRDGIRQMRIFDEIDNPVLYLKKKGIVVDVGKKNDIISISASSSDPTEAARLVNAVVDAYREYHSQSKRNTAGEILKILQNEKDKRDKELSEKLKAMMDFKSRNIGLAFENADGNIILDRLTALSTELTRAELRTVEAKYAFENTKSILTDPARLKQYAEGERAKGIFITNAEEWSRLETELEQLESRWRDLSVQAAANQPTLNALQAKIDQTKDRLAVLYRDFTMAQLAVAEQQYFAEKERQDQITLYFDVQRQKAIELNQQIAQYTILQSDWEQTKKLCDILDDRIKEVNIAEGVGGLNISVLEAAQASKEPSSPNKAKDMAIALFLGFIIAGSLALGRDWIDLRFHSVEEVSGVLGMPVLGVVPSMSADQSNVTRAQKVHLESGSSWAEAYRMIRTAILFRATKAKTKTILVTSPTAGDGKSTLVSNLAIAMAQAGQKTLILDADFRKSMQHRIFGCEHHDIGLSSILAGETDVQDAISHTDIECLDILPRGRDLPNPSETLNGQDFTRLLKSLEKKYDRIIVDSPPVLLVTDAQILAAICRVTILVLRADKTTRPASQQARDSLIGIKANILGVVVNDVPKEGRYGYYRAEGYYRKSGNGSKNSRQKERPRISAASGAVKGGKEEKKPVAECNIRIETVKTDRGRLETVGAVSVADAGTDERG